MKKIISVFLTIILWTGCVSSVTVFAESENPDLMILEEEDISEDILMEVPEAASEAFEVYEESGDDFSEEISDEFSFETAFEGVDTETDPLPYLVSEAYSDAPARAMAAAAASGAGNHTTATSGPKAPHTPKTYVWDMSKEYKLPQGNYSNYLQSLGILFPGDTLRILPGKDPNPNGAKGYHGVPGISLAGKDISGAGEKIGPVRVTKAISVGTPTEKNSYCKEYTYISEIVVEDAPVMLQVGGGGNGWASANPGDNKVPQDTWGGTSVNYIELPKYLPVQYYYNIPNVGDVVDYNGEYYGHAKENPEVIWMEDISLTWNPETSEYEVIGPTFQIYRPFIEGYSLVGFDSKSHSLASTRYHEEKVFENGQWVSTVCHFEGLQTAFTTKFTNEKLWDGETPLKIFFRFSQRYGNPETMALDANGGSISGYSRRLIDLENSGYFFGQESFPADYLPTRAGYTFTGWYADQACTRLIASADLTPAEMMETLKRDSQNRYSPDYRYIEYLDDPSDVYWHYNLYAGWKSKQIKKVDQTLSVSAPSSLTAGKTATITVNGKGEITYSSDKTALATVNENGVVTAIAPGTVNITVKAAGNDQYHAASKKIKITITCAKPVISKAENVNGGIKLTWGKVTGAARYRVLYKNGSSWKKLADTASTSYTWKKAVSGKKYTFTVRCLSSDSKSYTSSYNTTGKAITYIAAPALSKVQNTKSGVKITWKKSAGAAKYRVLRKTGSGKWQKVGDTTALSYVDKKAKKGVKYSYTVRCITKNAKSYTSGYNTKGLTILRK